MVIASQYITPIVAPTTGPRKSMSPKGENGEGTLAGGVRCEAVLGFVATGLLRV